VDTYSHCLVQTPQDNGHSHLLPTNWKENIIKFPVSSICSALASSCVKLCSKSNLNTLTLSGKMQSLMLFSATILHHGVWNRICVDWPQMPSHMQTTACICMATCHKHNRNAWLLYPLSNQSTMRNRGLTQWTLHERSSQRDSCKRKWKLSSNICIYHICSTVQEIEPFQCCNL